MKRSHDALAMPASVSAHGMNRGKLFVEIVTVLYILLFMYTGINKLIEYDIFSVQSGFLFVLQPYAPAIGIVVPTLEILIASLLLFKKTQVLGLYSAGILMTIFTLYIGWMLGTESDLPCTCGGVLQQMSWTQHLFFNIAFLLLTFLALRIIKRRNHLQ